MSDTDRAPRRKTPRDMQICIVEFRDGSQEYAVWTTASSMYGAGGHFQLGEGSMAGIPVDVTRWWGTHWLASEQAGIVCVGELSDTDRAPTPPADARLAKLIRAFDEAALEWGWARDALADDARSRRTAEQEYVDAKRALHAEARRLAARVAALEEALAPFAAVADQIEQDLGNVEDSRGLCVEMRHLRRARARLQPEEEGR